MKAVNHQTSPMSPHMYWHYGSTADASSYTARVLLRFNSRYCTYVYSVCGHRIPRSARLTSQRSHWITHGLHYPWLGVQFRIATFGHSSSPLKDMQMTALLGDGMAFLGMWGADYAPCRQPPNPGRRHPWCTLGQTDRTHQSVCSNMLALSSGQ